MTNIRVCKILRKDMEVVKFIKYVFKNVNNFTFENKNPNP